MTTPPALLLYSGIPAPTLAAIRADRDDGFGHPIVDRAADGGEPLRCCLRLSPVGDRIALIAYQPSRKGGPYAEIGPVFIHSDSCGGYAETAAYPADFIGRRAVLRPYDADGQMRDGLLAESGAGVALVADLLADRSVDVVQVRNVVAGCWNFDVRRGAAGDPAQQGDPGQKGN